MVNVMPRYDNEKTGSSVHSSYRMILYAMTLLAAGLGISSTSGAPSAPCPSGTIIVNVTSMVDVQNLTDELACAGEGSFNITWLVSLTIEERIEVSDHKNVTITGAGVLTTIRGPLVDDSNTDGIVQYGSGDGIFSVSDGSTLRLNNLVLDGGQAEKGGAVDVLSSSFLFVFDCTFTSNNASEGGEIPRVQTPQPPHSQRRSEMISMV